jgi:hypothetical protein
MLKISRKFSAYVCPCDEIQDEGKLRFAEMEEWNVPKSVIAKLRAALGEKLDSAAQDLESARFF